MSAQGHSPGQGPFDQFIALMNHDEAKDLVRNINLFMKGFKQSAPAAEADSRAVQGFLQQMETAMAKHPLFVNTTPQEQDAATEALEKYLMTKLHERTFRRSGDDVERDEALTVRCQALAFVRPEHLEIPPGVVDSAHLGRAVEELNKINKYKAPRDKLVCILNCCSMINAQLAKSVKAEGIGADDFTPLLIYVVIKARTPHLASNLAYIERYRYHPKLTAEAQYYYIQLCGAATFIEMINASSLKVDRDEFIAHMLAAGAMTDEQLASLQSNNSADMAAAAATAVAAAAAAADSKQGVGQGSGTQLNIQRSTQAAVAAATAAGIRPNDWQYDPSQQQQQQQQQFPLQMQPLPTTPNSPASGWPQAALGHSSPGWPYQGPQQQQQQQHGQALPQPPPPPQQQQLLPSVSELESQGAALLSQRDPAAAARQLVSRHPFCCSGLDSLSLGDVGQLLAAYKELVLRYEALTAALEHFAQQQQQQQTVGAGVAGTAAAVAAAAAVTGPPPPPAAAGAGEVLTPPTSTSGAGDALVMPALSPLPPAEEAPSAAAAEAAAAATASPAAPAAVAEGPAAAAAAAAEAATAAAGTAADVSPAQSAVEGIQQQQQQHSSPPVAATAAVSEPAAAAPAEAAAAEKQQPSPAAPAATATQQQQQQQEQQQQPSSSNVDELLHSLLSPESTNDAELSSSTTQTRAVQQQELQPPVPAAGAAGSAPQPVAVQPSQPPQQQPPQQQQQQQQQHAGSAFAGAEDDDMFGLFQGPPATAVSDAVATNSSVAGSSGAAVVPSLLD